MWSVLEPPIPYDEGARLATLRALKILDTPPEARFDRVTRTTAKVLDAPISLVTLVDSDRQWFKSCFGYDGRQTPRAISFCAHAIAGDEEMLVVEDATADERFADNPMVIGDLHVRFYAGRPLRAADGQKVGTLCVVGHEPRGFGPDERAILEDLSAWAETELNAGEASRALDARRRSEAQLQAILAAVSEPILAVAPSGRVVFANPAAGRLVGQPSADLVGLPVEGAIDVVGGDRPASATCSRTKESGSATLRRGDGETVEVDFASAPVPDGGGAVLVLRPK
jgi:PAS domain S-box-containing protein